MERDDDLCDDATKRDLAALTSKKPPLSATGTPARKQMHHTPVNHRHRAHHSDGAAKTISQSHRRTEHGGRAEEKANIQVAVRILGFNEGCGIEVPPVAGPPNQLALEGSLFNFSRVYTNEDNGSVFRGSVQGMVDWARRGYDVVIFTYGVTGSGKTFTMLNMESQPAVQTPEDYMGQVPQVLRYLLAGAAKDDSEVKLKELLLSVVEVNGQEVMDLLAPGAEPTRGAKIRIEDGSNDWWLDRSKVVERSITSVELAMQEIAGANRKRQWMATDNNPRSSRTHLIHTLALVTSVRSPTGAWRLAKSRVHLVDLAGSERLNGDVAADQKTSGIRINRTLLDLKTCMQQLHTGQTPTYRNCPLLRLLKSSLTRAQALMITCVTADPGKQARQEALATLQFASMTRRVQTCPRLNVLPDKEPKAPPAPQPLQRQVEQAAAAERASAAAAAAAAAAASASQQELQTQVVLLREHLEQQAALQQKLLATQLQAGDSGHLQAQIALLKEQLSQQQLRAESAAAAAAVAVERHVLLEQQLGREAKLRQALQAQCEHYRSLVAAAQGRELRMKQQLKLTIKEVRKASEQQQRTPRQLGGELQELPQQSQLVPLHAASSQDLDTVVDQELELEPVMAQTSSLDTLPESVFLPKYLLQQEAAGTAPGGAGEVDAEMSQQQVLVASLQLSDSASGSLKERLKLAVQHVRVVAAEQAAVGAPLPGSTPSDTPREEPQPGSAGSSERESSSLPQQVVKEQEQPVEESQQALVQVAAAAVVAAAAATVQEVLQEEEEEEEQEWHDAAPEVDLTQEDALQQQQQEEEEAAPAKPGAAEAGQQAGQRTLQALASLKPWLEQQQQAAAADSTQAAEQAAVPLAPPEAVVFRLQPPSAPAQPVQPVQPVQRQAPQMPRPAAVAPQPAHKVGPLVLALQQKRQQRQQQQLEQQARSQRLPAPIPAASAAQPAKQQVQQVQLAAPAGAAEPKLDQSIDSNNPFLSPRGRSSQSGAAQDCSAPSEAQAAATAAAAQQAAGAAQAAATSEPELEPINPFLAAMAADKVRQWNKQQQAQASQQQGSASTPPSPQAGQQQPAQQPAPAQPLPNPPPAQQQAPAAQAPLKPPSFRLQQQQASMRASLRASSTSSAQLAYHSQRLPPVPEHSDSGSQRSQRSACPSPVIKGLNYWAQVETTQHQQRLQELRAQGDSEGGCGPLRSGLNKLPAGAPGSSRRAPSVDLNSSMASMNSSHGAPLSRRAAKEAAQHGRYSTDDPAAASAAAAAAQAAAALAAGSQQVHVHSTYAFLFEAPDSSQGCSTQLWLGRVCSLKDARKVGLASVTLTTGSARSVKYQCDRWAQVRADGQGGLQALVLEEDSTWHQLVLKQHGATVFTAVQFPPVWVDWDALQVVGAGERQRLLAMVAQGPGLQQRGSVRGRLVKRGEGVEA